MQRQEKRSGSGGADLDWFIARSWRTRRRGAVRAAVGRAAVAPLTEALEPRRLFAAGDLDPSFGGGDGVLPVTFVPQFGANSTAHDIAALPDGKFIAVGTTDALSDGNTAMIVVKYNANGTLDGSFGAGGIVVTSFGTGPDGAHAVAAAPGGKIVVAGFATEGIEQEVAVARYNADGTLDASFSDDGVRSTGFGGRADTAHDVIVDPGGKIFLAGASGSDFLIARLNANGTNDKSFSGDGLVLAGFGATEAARGIAFLSSGRVAAGGSTSVNGGDFAFVVLTGSGAFDNSFSGDGRATLDFGGNDDAANDLLVTAGRLVAVGSTSNATAKHIAIARLTTDGQPDATFNGDGRAAYPDPGDGGLDAVWDGNRIVVGGSNGIVRFNGATGEVIGARTREPLRGLAHAGPDTFVVLRPEDEEERFAVSKFIGPDEDGTFGEVNEGVFNPDIHNGEVGRNVTRQSDGKLIVLASSRGQMLLTRYNPDGSVDDSFGFQGRAIADFSTIDPIGLFTVSTQQVEVLPDGRILAGGSTRINVSTGFAFARFNANGTLDTTFGGGDGLVTSPQGSDDTFMRMFTLLPGGGFLAGGGEGGVRFHVAKYNADGSPDTTFGGGGAIASDFGLGFDSSASFILPAPGDKIVFGGSYDDSTIGDDAFALVRLNADGSFDDTFSDDGILSDLSDPNVPPGERTPWELEAAHVLPDGRIVGAFTAQIGFGVTRITADGAVDTTFGTGGWSAVDLGINDFVTQILVDAAGRILVGGFIRPDLQSDQETMGIARFTAEGEVDTGFGRGDGFITRPLGTNENFASLLELSNGPGGTFHAYTRIDEPFTQDPQEPTRFEILRFQGGAVPTDPTTPAITIDAGVLNGRGTGGDDVITVRRHLSDDVIVTINGTSGTFDMDDFPGGVRLEGLGGNDRITIVDSLNTPVARRVTMNGGAGNDTLTGNNGNDSILGDDGDDTLIGNDGNDTLDGGNGDDLADGGGGANTFVGVERLSGSTAAASIALVGRTLTGIGTDDAETITIERFLSDDVIVRIGSLSRTFDMDDFDGVLLRGLGGGDTIRMLDAVVAGSLVRKVTIEGGAGSDSLIGSAGDEVMRGGDGHDTLRGLGGADALFGDFGHDSLVGGPGLDFMDGGDDDDFLDANDGVSGDTVLGGGGTDTAKVDAGDDVSGVDAFV